jgi:nucleoside-diphosphate-sugar epimerase
MRILLTGSGGFIGGALYRSFEAQKINVMRVHHDCLSEPEKLRELCDIFNPTHILHFAAYGNMSDQKDEQEMKKANIDNLWNLLNATKEIDYELFINCSTSSVYGWAKDWMQETDRIKPITMYASTKAAGEMLCRSFRKVHKKNIVTVRPFSVYGDFEARFRFIPTLILNKKLGVTSNVIDGNHDWIYISDFIRAIYAIMENVENLTHRTYNIGSGKMTPNKDIADMVGGEYEFTPGMKTSDSRIWKANISRLMGLNWKPQVSIEEGIEKVKRHYGIT